MKTYVGALSIFLMVFQYSPNLMADGDTYLSGCNKALHVMNTKQTEDTFAFGYGAGYCLGVVEGVITLLLVQTIADEAKICVPEAATKGQIIRIVTKYMNDHPALLHREPAALTLLALKDAYYCD